MRLDPSKCEPGTKGFLPQSSIYDYEGYGEGESVFDYFKEASVTLNADHKWEGENGVLLDDEAEVVVLSTWQDAVRYTLAQDRQQSTDILRGVVADLEQADKVEAWLEESHVN